MERYDSQTFLGSYRETSRASLLNEGLSTRANSLWKMAEYVIAKFDNTDNALDGYINGWRQLASGSNNQYLILEESANNWGLYNAQGDRLGGDDYLASYFEERRKKVSFSDASRMVLNEPLQQIHYGAPGTGKSHEIKRLTKGEAVVRTTFHPDSDYSTFVGAYKPTMVVEEARVVPVVLGGDGTRFNKNEGSYTEKRIVYRFVMQAFLKAYLGAWKKYSDADGDHIKPQFLIIEEINRGNCAQIFGDLFQLLDRSDNGFSEYPIEADTDLQKEIARAFEDDDSPFKLTNDINVEGVVENYTSNRDGGTLSKDIQEGYILLLPKNLYIWATMNTSDQSLFPIDSAFKRRWDWKYMPIDTRKETWYIKVGDKHYSWSEFLEKVNGVLLTDETAEDKHLGFYFCKATEKRDGSEKAPNVITMETFVGKVLFYLWNDVFKVYGIHSQIGSSKEWGYAKFYNTDGTVNIQKVNDLMGKLGIAPEGTDASTDEVDAEP